MIVIADAGPLRYLIVIEQVHLLPLLYGSIVVPAGVERELMHDSTPIQVRNWMSKLPNWVTVKAPQKSVSSIPFATEHLDLGLPTQWPDGLGLGELEAMALVEELSADVLLVDDEAARQAATHRGIPIQGTLGILDLAAEHGLLADFQEAMAKLQRTNFRASSRLYSHFLERDAMRKTSKSK